jgi:hypothetical protein
MLSGEMFGGGDVAAFRPHHFDDAPMDVCHDRTADYFVIFWRGYKPHLPQDAVQRQ